MIYFASNSQLLKELSRYSVWDQNGVMMFRSQQLDYPPLSVAWRPQGDTFLVGLHNLVLLCDAAGWVAAHARHRAGGAQVCNYSLALLPQLVPISSNGVPSLTASLFNWHSLAPSSPFVVR
jgi:hypothetical protein